MKNNKNKALKYLYKLVKKEEEISKITHYKLNKLPQTATGISLNK